MTTAISHLRVTLEVARDHLIDAIKESHAIQYSEPDAFSPTAHLGDIRNDLDSIIDQLYRQQMDQKEAA